MQHITFSLWYSVQKVQPVHTVCCTRQNHNFNGLVEPVLKAHPHSKAFLSRWLNYANRYLVKSMCDSNKKCVNCRKLSSCSYMQLLIKLLSSLPVLHRFIHTLTAPYKVKDRPSRARVQCLALGRFSM